MNSEFGILNQTDLPVIYLKPGELHFSSEKAMVVTVLGSCVSVVFFCRRLGMAGMTHGVLPTCDHSSYREGMDFKYCDCSTKYLLSEFRKKGIPNSELEVKIFGGSVMSSNSCGTESNFFVGQKNLAMVWKILESESIKITAQDVGGKRGRKIYLDTRSGDVIMKRLGNQNVNQSQLLLKDFIFSKDNGGEG